MKAFTSLIAISALSCLANADDIPVDKFHPSDEYFEAKHLLAENVVNSFMDLMEECDITAI